MEKSKNKDILDKAKSHISDIMAEQSSDYLYHNLAHTKQVAEAANELADDFFLEESDREILTLAAYFHDIAYAKTKDHHEVKSAEMARAFLESEDYPKAQIEEVTQCILATQMNAQPETLLQQIIKDADCSHLGKKNMQLRSDLLRTEMELVDESKISDLDWMNTNIEFLLNHQFYTPIAKTKWNKRKRKNLKKLQKKAFSLTKEDEPQKKIPIDPSIYERPIKRSRGVETLFRVTLRNHIDLSSIADNKANFLLSISGIIVSLLLGELVTDNKPVVALLLPTIYFLIVCVITMVLSILATRPNVTKGKFSRESLLKKQSNILFFGNFHAMPREEFEWGIDQLMQNDILLYDSLTKDLYYLGVVLNKKYKLLRYAFNFFMFGIISSAIFYTVMLIIN